MEQSNAVEIESCEHFVKQTYRNRCRILTANGVENLIVPVIHSDLKIPIRDARIDYSQNWPKQHWGAIVAAYAKAPYFEYFADDFEKILFRKTPFLFDLNWEILTLCLKWLRINTPIRLTTQYNKTPENGQFDARSLLHPKKSDLSNILGQPIVYKQNFGNEFVPHLSILDALMCHGTEVKSILKKSQFAY